MQHSKREKWTCRTWLKQDCVRSKIWFCHFFLFQLLSLVFRTFTFKLYVHIIFKWWCWAKKWWIMCIGCACAYTISTAGKKKNEKKSFAFISNDKIRFRVMVMSQSNQNAKKNTIVVARNSIKCLVLKKLIKRKVISFPTAFGLVLNH